MDSARARVFAYGTLEIGAVMNTVTGMRFEAVPARAPGFARFRVAGEVYPGMLEAPDGLVSGTLYRGVDGASLALLDRFEGDLYERRRLEVEERAGGRLGAWAWVVRPQHAHRLSREPWRRDEFVERHLAVYLEQCRAFRRDAEARRAP